MNSKWEGNPGSRPTNFYKSHKSILCPEASWAGADVNQYLADGKEIFKCNAVCFWDMPDGRIAHAVLRSHGKDSVHHDGDFYLVDNEISFSSDDGHTWTDPISMNLPNATGAPGIWDANQGDLYLVDVLSDDKDGYLVFTLQRYAHHKNTALLLCRTKDFETFTPWENVTSVLENSYYVVNNDRIIRMKSGRILIPIAKHTWTDYGNFSAGKTCFVYSDDNGKSWVQSPTASEMPWPAGFPDGCQEPGVVELNDGRLWAYIRTRIGCQCQQFSVDGGHTWSAIEPSIFKSPLSPMTITRIADEKLVAVWNPVPENDYHKPRYTARTPIVISISHDDGKTWEPFRVMDDAPKANYAYPHVFVGKEYILVSYWYHSRDEFGEYCNSKIKRIELSEL